MEIRGFPVIKVNMLIECSAEVVQLKWANLINLTVITAVLV